MGKEQQYNRERFSRGEKVTVKRKEWWQKGTHYGGRKKKLEGIMVEGKKNDIGGKREPSPRRERVMAKGERKRDGRGERDSTKGKER